MAEKRRDGRHPIRLSLYISEELQASLHRASERYGVAVASLARAALVRGFPAELQSRRKKAGKAGGTPAAQDSAT